MMLNKFRPLAIIAAALLFLAVHPQARGEAPMVASETGFEGAVEIVDSGEEDGIQFVTGRIPYRDMHGNTKYGLGRLYLRAEDQGKSLPAFIHVHYEKDLGGAKRWCNRGWAVASSHYDAKEGYPLDVSVGDSNNLQRALIEWVRRIPFIDHSRLHIDGGSQGGYMALAMAAEFFPVTAVTADVPVINWAYNLNYFEANKHLSGYGKMLPQQSPLPVVCMVSELASEKMMSSPVPGCYGVFGSDLAADAWYWVSPISFVDRITSPVLTFAATGDMLVPYYQFTSQFDRPFDPELFPDGFTRDFETLTLNDKARVTLEEKLGPDKLGIYLQPLPEKINEFQRDNMVSGVPMPKEGMDDIERWWDPKKQWSLVILDEGGPLPHSPHSRYDWKTSPDAFVAHYKDAVPAIDLLTPAMFARLVERYRGALSNLPELADGTPANRLNFSLLEQRDVIDGLLTYARFSEDHATQLATIANTTTPPLLEAPVTAQSLQAEIDRIDAALGRENTP